MGAHDRQPHPQPLRREPVPCNKRSRGNPWDGRRLHKMAGAHEMAATDGIDATHGIAAAPSQWAGAIAEMHVAGAFHGFA